MPDPQNEQRYAGVRVTAEDIANGDNSDTIVYHDYVLVAAGGCFVAHTNVSFAKDGTQTHVVTIKGIRRAVSADV